ncbi:putative type I restriction-modification system (methylase S subunit) [Legionella steelei]|uniref:Putative type I restriction-modification system (Methylase S subunit) n=1 Tax=Legionella steelei TaxID=947033 RepID=A0A0W0ZIQ6_9GAMM|nr:restriction endonuclease subunit S [Legionella steelei]KTD69292.1 putative type I restriction-modification system (methylase S subunit) [Legionella steelei]
MSNKKTTPLKPKLRFPEFRDTSEWEEKTLLDVCKKITQGGTPDTTNSSFWNGQIEWLTPAEMGKTESYFINSTKRKITSDGLKNCSSELLPINSVILSTRAPIGHLAINSTEMAINQGCKGLIPKESTDCTFLYYILYNLKSCLINLGAGNTFKELSGSVLKKFTLSLPIYREQQKIADCLSSIDELITAENKKLDALKTYKKGLMQQLFPAEGEIPPKLRFSEFQNAQEWKLYLLGSKSIKIGSGITPNGGEKNYKNNGRPFIRSQNVGWGELLLENVAFIDNATHLTFSATEIKENDVLLNITGASIGRSAIADKRIEGGNVNQHVCIIRVKLDELLPKLLNQYLLSEYGQNQIDGFQAGGNRQGLNFSQIKSFSIPLPNTLQEQQKISDCLSSIDELITAESKKLEALNNHKKGLMQQLFPSISEL